MSTLWHSVLLKLELSKRERTCPSHAVSRGVKHITYKVLFSSSPSFFFSLSLFCYLMMWIFFLFFILFTFMPQSVRPFTQYLNPLLQGDHVFALLVVLVIDATSLDLGIGLVCFGLYKLSG